MNNKETIQNLYAAFQRGDVEGILALVAEDVNWNNQGVESRECPWNGDFSGKVKLPGFFKTVNEDLKIEVFDIKEIVASGSCVAVHLRIESVLPKNNRSLKNDVVHFWQFNDRGEVASYRHFNDTAAELLAWRE